MPGDSQPSLWQGIDFKAKVGKLLKGLQVAAGSVAGSEQGVPVLRVQVGQGGDQAAGVAANTAALFEGGGVINANIQTLLQPSIGPQAIDPEIPKQHYANGKGFGNIITPRLTDVRYKKRINTDNNQVVNQQTD